jgi:uncharacterized membrane protein
MSDLVVISYPTEAKAEAVMTKILGLQRTRGSARSSAFAAPLLRRNIATG